MVGGEPVDSANLEDLAEDAPSARQGRGPTGERINIDRTSEAVGTGADRIAVDARSTGSCFPTGARHPDLVATQAESHPGDVTVTSNSLTDRRDVGALAAEAPLEQRDSALDPEDLPSPEEGR